MATTVRDLRLGDSVLVESEIASAYAKKDSSQEGAGGLSTINAEDYSPDELVGLVNRIVSVVRRMNGLSSVVAALAWAAALFASPCSAGSLDVETRRLGSVRSTNEVVVSVREAEKACALFIIPLNPDGRTGWTGFELKASTNNFSSSGASDRLVFWYPADAMNFPELYDAYNYDPAKVFMAGGDSWSTRDVRSWVRYDNTTSVGSDIPCPSYVACLVSTNGLRRCPDGRWLREGNEELVWSYIRSNPSSMETHGDERHKWNPIMPVRWYRDVPEWAKR